MKKTNRRRFLAKGAAVAAVAGAAGTAAAQSKPERKVLWRGEGKPENPLFSPLVTYGNLVFVAGKGYHQEATSRSTPTKCSTTSRKNSNAPGHR